MEISQYAFDKQIFRKAKENRLPIYGAFELTGRCNLNCVMCYVRKAPGDQAAIREELSAAQWIEIARQARDEGMLYLLLTGGEVFLRPDFFEILDGLSELGIRIIINTNATMINGETAARLAQYPISSVAVTVYGASPETYGSISGNPAGFEMTMRGVRNLMDAGISVRLRTMIVRQNVGDLERLFDLGDELGLIMRINGGVFNCREGAGNDPYGVRLTPEEQLQCEDFYMRRSLAKAGVEIPEPREPDYDDLMSGDIAEAEAKDNPDGRPGRLFKCAAGNSMFTVSPKGRLGVCLLLDEPSVSLLSDMNFKRAWEDVKSLCDKLPHCQECLGCRHRKYCKCCPAKLWGETGSFTKKPPYVCERAELIATGKYLAAGSFH